MSSTTANSTTTKLTTTKRGLWQMMLYRLDGQIMCLFEIVEVEIFKKNNNLPLNRAYSYEQENIYSIWMGINGTTSRFV